MLVGFSAVALVLDAVDGAVARRTGTASTFGARFDMEIDAFLIMVLSVYGCQDLRRVGAGDRRRPLRPLDRRAVVAVAAQRPLPFRYWRKVVAAIQGIVLTAVIAGLLPRPSTWRCWSVAAALLAESFGRDVWWLWRHRPRPAAGRSGAPDAGHRRSRRPVTRAPGGRRSGAA